MTFESTAKGRLVIHDLTIVVSSEALSYAVAAILVPPVYSSSSITVTMYL